MSEQMCYVAADPQQPGAAWAAMVDDPNPTKERKREVAKELSGWIRDGASVERVSVEKAREMLSKWEKPTKQKADSQAALI